MIARHATFACCGATVVPPVGEHKCLEQRERGNGSLGNAQGTREGGTPPTAHAAPSRFHSTPTVRDGILFASKGEAALYDLLRARGEWVLPHPRFPLIALLEPGRRAVDPGQPDVRRGRISGG